MDKWVLITGASKGIGASIAEKFASKNYNIYLNYLHNDALALEKKKELEEKYGVKVILLKFDVSKEEEVKLNLEKIKRLDCLVNNAGISLDQDIQDKSALDFKKVIDTNLLGTFLVSKYASCLMAEGSIINIASNSIFKHTYPESVDYDASKAGVVSLTHSFALSLAPDIRVNCLCPGWVETDMNQDLSASLKEEILNKSLLHRFASIEEIANAVYFLASNEASYINDTVLKVDGGYYD